MKRNKCKSRTSFIAAMAFAVAGLFTGADAMLCSGTVSVQKPAGWTEMYVVVDGTFIQVPETALSNGWYTFEIAGYGGQYAKDFLFASASNGWNSPAITTKTYNSSTWDQTAKFTCTDITTSTTGTLYISEDLNAVGTTYYGANPPNAKYFYFLSPDEADWMSSTPILSADGGRTGTVMTPDPSRCGWFYTVWFNSDPPDSAVVFRDDDTTDVLNLHGSAIHLKDSLNVNSKVYFVPEDDSLYALDPGVEGTCSYNLAALLYDTDSKLHGGFTCDAYPNVASNGCYDATAKYAFPGNGGSNTVPCIGVTRNMVQSTLGSDKKPVYNSASGCLVSDEAFKAMFDTSYQTSFRHCRDIAFSRSSDGLWEYDSYNSTYGAFTPLNDLEDSITAGTCTGRCATAAGLHEGLGNIQYGAGTPTTVNAAAKALYGSVTNWSATNPATGLPYIDTYPVENGEFDNGTHPDVYDNTTWDTRKKGQFSGQNNEFYCFESHANFKYKKGLKFSFRGDDDIWVFIDGKLAVDLGGTHLAAPAYIDLDTITGTTGALITQKSYPLDIFFCDRRTNMSNVRIKTNMFIEQNSAVYSQATKEDPNTLQICMDKTGDGSCEALASGTSTNTITLCGSQITETVKYYLFRGATFATLDSGKTVLDTNYFATGTQFFGGITIDRANNKATLNSAAISGLPSGTYKFYAVIAGKKTKLFTFRVAGVLDVMNAKAAARDSTTGAISQTWSHVNSALADTRIPVYVSAVSDPIDGYLDVDLSTAMNQTYTLAFSKNLTLYESETSTTPITSATALSIDASGVDTLWATMTASAIATAQGVGTIQVSGRARVDTLTFTLPKIAFVDSTYSKVVSPSGITAWTDAENLWVGAYYTVRLAVYDPTIQPNLAVGDSIKICTTCSFDASVADYSAGMNFSTGTNAFTDGKYTLMFNSSKEYDATAPASFTVVGAGNVNVAASWTGLIFKKPPVPYPEHAEIHDARGVQTTYNGLPDSYKAPSYLDGIADSLRIVYSRPFPKDSLPDSIQVRWAVPSDADSVVTLTKAEILAATKLLTDTTYDSVLTFGGKAFSSKVKTGGAGTLTSYTQYKAATFPISSVLADSIAPIITSASITESKLVSGYFTAMFRFSEPVKLTDLAGDGGKTAFSYYLRSATDKDVNGRYQASAASSFSLSGDSIATLVYQDNGATDIPAAGDFARIRADLSIITDTLGNKPTDYTAPVASPWIELQGDASSHVTSISITKLNEETMQERKNAKSQIIAYGVDVYASKDSIRAEYPGTLGYIIQTDMGQILSSDANYIKQIDNGNLKLSDVKLHYENYIFTNLGQFVASSKKTVACNDPMFSADGKSEGDCRSTRKYVFVSWNLMSSDKRFVGSGAYISKLSTYISIGSKKDYKHNVTQTWGVMRGNGKIK